MPKLRGSPEEERERAILGQISQKSWLKYGKKMSGERVGKLFGVGGKTALNRLHNLGSFRLDELWDYTKRCSLTNEEILAWFGR